jgi:hypothetical protein
VLAIDNHSRHNFVGLSSEVEQEVIKIDLHDIDSAQQSKPYLSNICASIHDNVIDILRQG